MISSFSSYMIIWWMFGGILARGDAIMTVNKLGSKHMSLGDANNTNTCRHTSSLFSGLCCLNEPPSKPQPRSLELSFFIAAQNDNYGGYRAALRSSSSLLGIAYGSYVFNLYENTELILVDWGSDDSAPLRCTPEFQKVLGRVPPTCEGTEIRTCKRDFVQIIQVPPALASKYAPGSAVSEVHTFNIAVRRARGEMLLRIDQDTFVRGPFFSWLHWQKINKWPDIKIVWWHVRDSGIRKDLVHTVVDDLKYYIHHGTHSCPDHKGPIPDRGPYNASKADGDGANWRECHNAAVGVYGYPVDLMVDVKGMNEKYTYWGGMEAELCTRASKSSKFVNWMDIRSEVCGLSFSHFEHSYGERLDQGAHETSFANDENWGLKNETLETWIY